MGNNEAIQSLKLADSYLNEVMESLEHIEGNESLGRDMLNTIGLSVKQLDKAEQLDPSAHIDGLDINYLRANAFGIRGAIESDALGKRSVAISSLKKSIDLCDDIDISHYTIGAIYANTGNKEEAIKHLRRAVELNPDNMEYRKLLDRLGNVSGVGMKVGAFRGSWKVILVLSGLSLVGLIMAASGEAGAGIFNFLFWGAIAFIYWKVKSK